MVESQIIVDGRVWCMPRRADTDIEECLRCRDLWRIDADASPPRLVCEFNAPLLERVERLARRSRGANDLRES